MCIYYIFYYVFTMFFFDIYYVFTNIYYVFTMISRVAYGKNIVKLSKYTLKKQYFTFTNFINSKNVVKK